MIVNKQCACGQSIEFEAEELAALTCPACGRSLHDQFAPKPASVPPGVNTRRTAPAVSSKPITLPSEPQITLETVRRTSCYKALRSLIEASVGILGVLLILSLIGAIFAVISSPNTDSIIAFGLFAVLAIFSGAVLMAFRQAMLLGIDAVDVLIADRADRLREQTARREHALNEFAAADK